jgi:hypothetical protein
MLTRRMALVETWDEIESLLAGDWTDAQVRLVLADETEAARADELLGPVNPWRTGNEVRLYVVARGTGTHLNAVRRALLRLENEGIDGTLQLVGSASAPAAAKVVEPTLVESWDGLLATLPPDWSDLYLEVELGSSDYVARASLNLSPLNARRERGRTALRFRAAKSFGYGAAPEMVRRCLERCDAEGIRGAVRILLALSDTHPVGTQGPVFQLGGRTT